MHQKVDENSEELGDGFEDEDEELQWSWSYLSSHFLWFLHLWEILQKLQKLSVSIGHLQIQGYVCVCLLMPCFNGLINSYCWSGLALHYVDMGWPISRAGMACMIGFGARPIFQQLQLRLGFWVAVPLGILHLLATIVGIIFSTEEWAVILEVGVLQALDPTITIEGIAFDVFGLSETMARQASSTVLAVFTIAIAASVTIGGIIYDISGWQAMSVFHLVCQAVCLLLLVIQPVVFKSFKEKWFKGKEEKPEVIETESKSEVVPTSVVPTSGGAEADLQVEDFHLPGAVKDEVDFENHDKVDKAESPHPTKGTAESPNSESGHTRGMGRRSQRHSQKTTQTSQTSKTHRTGMTAMTMMTGASARTCRTALTRGTHVTGRTVLSRITSQLKDSEGFQYHFGANAALLPSIAQRAGPETEKEEKGETASKRVPKDLRVPVALIVLCFFCNTFSYVIEFGTFAIYFKEYHGWESATWASLAQTSGDLTAAVMMKVLPNNVEEGTEDVGILKRLVMQPYNVSCLLLCWILCNLGMVSPLLPIAVTAQVLMGTVFVYVIKMASDLNVFYSLGDSDLYMTMTLFCKNAEAIGGCVASILGPVIYDSISPQVVFFIVLFLFFLFETINFEYREKQCPFILSCHHVSKIFCRTPSK